MYTNLVFALLSILSVAGFVICFTVSDLFSSHEANLSFVSLGYAFCLLFLAIMSKILYFTWLPILLVIFSIIIAVYSIFGLIRRNREKDKRKKKQNRIE